ncbi:MAG: ankyrin repeat domain-containing protein [Burkholderiales bacterium]
MINYFNKFLHIFVFIVLISTQAKLFAGAFDDFFKAIALDDARGVTSLLQRGFDPNTRNQNGVPGIVLAASESSLKSLDVLLSWPKVDVEARNADDESALMMVSLRGHFDIAKRLIARNADVNKTGWAPLHYAASGGHVDAIALLLEHHAYIDAESPNGTTPLMMAARYGNIESVKLLLERGADATLKNQLKLDALDFAELGSRPDAIQLLSIVLKRQPRPQQLSPSLL